MTQMKIYGSPMSRASRVMWCAKEAGVPFEHVDVPWDKLKDASYLSINPNGKVPGFVDGGLKLFESLAIILYICKKYSLGKLYPASLEDEAKVFQWTLWGATEVEALALPSVMLKFGMGSDAATAKAAAARLPGPLKVVDEHLKSHPWMLGNAFSVADITVCTCVFMARLGEIDISQFKNVTAWLDKCLARQGAGNGH